MSMCIYIYIYIYMKNMRTRKFTATGGGGGGGGSTQRGWEKWLLGAKGNEVSPKKELFGHVAGTWS